MARTILALVENTIGTQLLLSTRLHAVGYDVTFVGTPDRLLRRLKAKSSDWLLLDGQVLGSSGQRLLAELATRPRPPRLAWLGRPPRQTPLAVAAVFTKPLRYGEIERFFSHHGPTTRASRAIRPRRARPRAVRRAQVGAPRFSAETVKRDKRTAPEVRETPRRYIAAAEGGDGQ